MEDKVAVVVGGSHGIGKAIVRAFASEGARVVVAARRLEALQCTVNDVVALGGRAQATQADITDEVSVSMLFDEVGRRYPRLDVLVNSAGVGGQRCPIASMSTAEFDRVVGTNLRGTFFSCRAGFRLMQERGGGTIINISSLAGIRAWPGAGAYCAAKHGIMGLTKALAHEGRAHGIRVCALCPGGVARLEPGASRPDDELIESSDVASAAVFLAALGPTATIHQLVLDQLAGSDW